MKAQAQGTSEGLSPQQQPTPVIIKMSGGGGGGGGSALSDTNSIKIDSDFMPFEDSTGGTWHEAVSTYPGRIEDLTLRDGTLNPLFCQVFPGTQSDDLTSLELVFTTPTGKEFLYAEESKDDKDGLIRLRVRSASVPFQATGTPSAGEWTSSKATFPNTPLKATFAQRRTGEKQETFKFEYLFNTSEVFVNINYHVEL